MAHVRIKRFRAGYAEKDGAEHEKRDPTAMNEKACRVGWAQGDEHGGMMDQRCEAKHRDRDEPDEHDWAEGAADFGGAERLRGEKRNEDHDRQRQDEIVQFGCRDLQAFESRENGDRRGDGTIAIDQRRAEKADRDDERALLALDAEQRHQRQYAALTVVVDAHGEGHIFDRRDNNQRPDQQREDAEYMLLAGAAGHVQHGL